MKKVLVTFGSLRGGTEGLAVEVARTLRQAGLAVDCKPVTEVDDLHTYQAVVIGGALYANRWVRAARRFVIRHERELRGLPVWMFSSGPLDDSASYKGVPTPPSVDALATRIGAAGHIPFGGRLAPNAEGFIAHAMAKQHAGDWRDWSQVRDWAAHVGAAIVKAPHVSPRLPPPPARWLLATLCAAVALTAIAGGTSLMLAPDGSLIHAPRELLEHTPFASFFVPGLALVVVVGLANALAAARVLRHLPSANPTAVFAGVALFGWILGEMVLLRTTEPVQIGYLVVALAIVGEALRRRAREPAPRQLGAATR